MALGHCNSCFYVIILDIHRDALGDIIQGMEFKTLECQCCKVIRLHLETGMGGVVFTCATLSMHKQARAKADRYPPTRMYSLRYDRTEPGLKMPKDLSIELIYEVVERLEEWQEGQAGSLVTGATLRSRAGALSRHNAPHPNGGLLPEARQGVARGCVNRYS